MRARVSLSVAVCLALMAPATAADAQDSTVRKDAEPTSPLFGDVGPLPVTFTANLRRLRSDRDSNAPWRTMTIAYRGDGRDVVIHGKAHTRGIWRLKNCSFPPLRLSFVGRETKGTLFRHVGRPKLVNHCKNTDRYETYILQEVQLYRIYQLLTPTSYRTRLVRMAYVDSANLSTDMTRYAIIVEDPDAMASRLGGKIVKTEGATAADFEADQLALAYLFQYMIGNIDFSFNRLHNTSLVSTRDGRLLPIAYDFDYTGAVDAEYARPDPMLGQRRVRERKFRGYCALADEYPKLLPLFHARRAAIYALYRDEIGQLLAPDVVRETLAYFDEFYEAIATPPSAERAFLRDCVGPR